MNKEEYKVLVKRWMRQTHFHSFYHNICRGSDYETLKDAGQEIVPFILDDLKTDIWIGRQWLLRDITGQDIWFGSKEDNFRKINVRESANMWIEWGQKNKTYWRIVQKLEGSNWLVYCADIPTREEAIDLYKQVVGKVGPDKLKLIRVDFTIEEVI